MIDFCQVIPALCGDASLTNAMDLSDFLKPSLVQQVSKLHLHSTPYFLQAVEDL